MADNPRKVSEPVLPEIEKCPRCGHHVLIGDTQCEKCRYDLQTTKDRLRDQPPMVVTVGLFVVGVLLAAASTGMENPWQFFVLVLGFGCIVAGGLYYAADLLLFNADDKRKKR